MIISEERQSHFAQIIVNKVWDDDLVDYTDDDLAFKVAKRVIVELVAEFEEVDQKARATVSSLKRNVPEGSPEWDVMYNKYFEEELKRRGYN